MSIPFKKFKTWREAEENGWILIPCAFPLRYNYFIKDGYQMREDQLIESKE